VSGGIVERSIESGVRDLDEGPEAVAGELWPDIFRELGVTG